MSLSAPKPARRTPDSPPATVAALLSWLVPGAGQLYLGRIAAAAAWFVVVEGLFVLGYLLSHGMTFQYLDPELRTTLFAPVLSPESGNLGALLFQLRDPWGSGAPAPWPTWMVLGATLTATSGVLNAVCMVHAHVSARDEGAPRAGLHPVVPVAATWICPGLGHLLSGRVRRGFLVFLLLVGLFALGTLLAHGSNLSRERHFYYWAGQFVLGGPALLAQALWGGMRVTSEIRYADAGLVFGCVAGLLNALVMIDAFAASEVRWLGLETPPSAATPGEAHA